MPGHQHLGARLRPGVASSSVPGSTSDSDVRGDTDERRRGVIAGLSAYLIWGALTVYWKLLRHFDAIELIGWRVISAAVVMASVLTVGRSWSRLRPVVHDRRLLGRVVIAALLLTSNWTGYVWAIVHGHVIETALGYFMAPLGTMLVGVVVFGEHLRTSQRVAVVLASVAIVVLTFSYGSVPWLALVIAVSWSMYGWMKKQVPLSPLESMSAETLVLLIPAILTVSLLSGHANSVLHTGTNGQLALVALTGVATIVPLTLFAFAASRVPLTVLGPMQYSVPTINFLLGWLLYGEALPLSRLIGFSLVWAGLAIVTVDTLRRARRLDPPAGSSGLLQFDTSRS